MEGALLVELVAFLGFALALQFVPTTASTNPGIVLRAMDRTPGRFLPLVWAAVGLAGLFLTFRGIGLLIAYFTDPTTAEQMRTEAEGTWTGLPQHGPAPVPGLRPDRRLEPPTPTCGAAAA